MVALYVMMSLAVAAVAGADVSRQSYHCAGKDLHIGCTATGTKIVSMEITLFMSSAVNEVCSVSDNFSAKELCSHTSNTEGLGAEIYGQCIEKDGCSIVLPLQTSNIKSCDSSPHFYGVHVEYRCSGSVKMEPKDVPQGRSPKIFRRSVSANSKDSHGDDWRSHEKHGRNSHSHNSFEKKNGVRDTNSIEKPGHISQRSKEANSMERNSFDKSRNDKSDEYGRTGSRGGAGKRITSYDKNGQPVYSGSHSQLNSGAAQSSGVVLSLLAACYIAALVLGN